MAALGSFLTGVGSEPTGNDSVLTAAGVCAPFPGQFITDGASQLTSRFQTVLTAAQNFCGPILPPNIVAKLVYWFKPDVGVTQNGSNQVSLWKDQSGNARDILPQNSLGSLRPTSQWPVFTPSVFPSGLAGMTYVKGIGPNTGTLMTWVPPGNPPNQPTADGAGVTMLGFGMATGIDGPNGGVFATLRLTSFDLELGYRVGSQPTLGTCTFYVSTNADHNAFLDLGAVSYNNQVIVLAAEYTGATAIPSFLLINGVQHTMTGTPDTGLANYSGNSGFGIGWIPSVDAGHFPGKLGEQMCYLGVNRADTLAANKYMMQRAGLI